MVERISVEKDLAKLHASIPRSLASAIPERILYQHGQVGECNDLIFGFSLVDYATAKGLGDGDIPRIVKICIHEIDQRGLETEGIYRVRNSIFLTRGGHRLMAIGVQVSGRHAAVHTVSPEPR